jgi:predicted 2-oxoglutarate/Fe(II)-dependent dioxygenase YbiX
MSGTVSHQLAQALKKVDRPGSFCISGGAPTVLPGLNVAGLGPIGFPLTAAQAKELKTLCRQAPYGKGEKTVVDTSVRRVWQLDPDQFTLTNPEWQQFLRETVQTVQTGLGLAGQKLESHLYNLLLYEPGSFFLPHRDGEKLDRMVATLVLALPSAYQGGELVVRHEGQEQTIDFSADGNPFHTHFAAFYADCEHEVRPLREGYRLCLVYNLTLAKAKKSLTAPRIGERVEEVADILRKWSAGDDARKLAVTLHHRYTQDGLVWDALKGLDCVRAKVLADAARQAGCKAYLAALTFWESGSAPDDGGYRHDRRRWRHESFDDVGEDEDFEDDEDMEDDEDQDHSGKYTMEEVFDSSLTAERWSDAEGNRPPLGPMVVEPEEVVPPESLTKEVLRVF